MSHGSWHRALSVGLLLFSLGIGLCWTGNAAAQTSAVVVVKRFGAALRVGPSSDADVYVTASCGDVLTVVGSSSGWYQVLWNGNSVWVGGARVASASNPGSYSCRGARTFQIGDEVVTSVPTGCLSLRYTPSRSAGYDSCVSNGHRYIVENGPIEVNGEDWFGVWSSSTGSGWSLAEDLYASP